MNVNGTPRHDETPDRDRSAAHVLVVDDKQGVREFLTDVLDMGGYAVTAVRNAEEAIASAGTTAPHVILTDLRMEGMDGQALIQTMREEHPTAVSIVLTGYGTVERTVELMRAGAFDVLTKPCRATEILATVEKAVEHHRALWANQELRRRLHLQDKLAMIGKLAAGVAHELNNPLDATLRCVRMTRERTGDDEESQEYLEIAQTGLMRMADIVQGLLTFSRNAVVEQAPEDLGTVLDSSLQSVSLALGNGAPTFDRRYEADVETEPVPRGLHQVVTNLVRNAADAHGRKQEPIEVHARVENDRVIVRIKDRGEGIDDEAIERVFEPFFTTKEPGRGTGLGLPISARLVERFGGTLRLDCPADGGTVATIELPRTHRNGQGK